MKLTVVIVNYNVEFFLEQCLSSVREAMEKIEGEVYVVDNHSIDGSVQMVKEKFPEVNLIASKENLGFSKGNNLAMKQAKGEYILLLNPDTVVQKDTFKKVCDFMDEHPDAGGLGVKMIDGKGEFLPESKRGLPTPKVAFYKIFGLARLFPKSKKFGQYHLSYLDKDKTHKVDVLSGAFMLMRKKCLDEIGLLDETFFMYGEDIDLSYRIQKGGYENYYFPETTIIHYKGESTKKSSVNYVFVFYRAMIIFAEKHFSQRNAKTFSFLINLAIYLRAGMAIVYRFLKKAVLPLVDFACLTSLLFLITKLYQSQTGKEFPDEILWYALPAYSLTWMLFSFFSGAYDIPVRLIKGIKGVALGSLLILAAYALLDKDYQFSRMIILLGSASALLYFVSSRLVLHFTGFERFRFAGAQKKRIGIVGSKEEVARVENILKSSDRKIDFLGFISDVEQEDDYYLGSISQMDQVLDVYDLNELIFCAANLEAGQIITAMSKIGQKNLEFKIAQADSEFIIGSNSIHSNGDLYVLNLNTIQNSENKRVKRVFDLSVSVLLLLLSPLLFLFAKSKLTFFKSLFLVLFGIRSFVGFSNSGSKELNLPKIKKGVLDILPLNSDGIKNKQVDKLNKLYARDYSWVVDAKILMKKWRLIGCN